MGKTSIEWTQETWNPVRGCSKISPGCENCYAMHQAARFSGEGQPYQGLVKRSPTNWTGEVRLIESALFEPLRRRKPTTWFVNSMSDLFHEQLPFEAIDYIVAVMALTPQHTFQVLTKRAERMAEYFSDAEVGYRIYRLITTWLDEGRPGPLGRQWDRCHDLTGRSASGTGRIEGTFWRLPLPNLWLGVSVENQKYAEERIPRLLETPAAVRFLSCEPLLGPIDLERAHRTREKLENWLEPTRVDWVVVGGESGDNARPCDPSWVRRMVKDCRMSRVPCFVKQLGSNIVEEEETHDWPNPYRRVAPGPVKLYGGEYRRRLMDKKGGDPNEWTEDLRVREMPHAIAEAAT